MWLNDTCRAVKVESLSLRGAAYPAVLAALDDMPATLLRRSGSVFYTGQAAFAKRAELYILGLNPGGDPVAQRDQTITADRQRFLDGSVTWSAYADESWSGSPPGAWGMQPRIIHMIAALGLDPRTVPASNVVFVRSATEAMLLNEKAELLRQCWPVHRAVIDALGVRVVACLGSTAGRWVGDALGATERVDEYREANGRGWTSVTHQAADGRRVVTLSHPGRANWCNPASDPTPLVQRALAQVNVG